LVLSSTQLRACDRIFIEAKHLYNSIDQHHPTPLRQFYGHLAARIVTWHTSELAEEAIGEPKSNRLDKCGELANAFNGVLSIKWLALENRGSVVLLMLWPNLEGMMVGVVKRPAAGAVALNCGGFGVAKHSEPLAALMGVLASENDASSSLAERSFES
jgi:hypothetical protein